MNKFTIAFFALTLGISGKLSAEATLKTYDRALMFEMLNHDGLVNAASCAALHLHIYEKANRSYNFAAFAETYPDYIDVNVNVVAESADIAFMVQNQGFHGFFSSKPKAALKVKYVDQGCAELAIRHEKNSG